MSAWAAATNAGPQEGVRVLNDSVHINLEDDPAYGMKLGDNEVYLDLIKSMEPKKGHGTLAMEFVCALASKHGVDIVVHASGVDENSPSDWELTQFYKKHGFVKCGPNNQMFRPAMGFPAA